MTITLQKVLSLFLLGHGDLVSSTVGLCTIFPHRHVIVVIVVFFFLLFTEAIRAEGDPPAPRVNGGIGLASFPLGDRRRRDTVIDRVFPLCPTLVCSGRGCRVVGRICRAIGVASSTSLGFSLSKLLMSLGQEEKTVCSGVCSTSSLIGVTVGLIVVLAVLRTVCSCLGRDMGNG